MWVLWPSVRMMERRDSLTPQAVVFPHQSRKPPRLRFLTVGVFYGVFHRITDESKAIKNLLMPTADCKKKKEKKRREAKWCLSGQKVNSIEGLTPAAVIVLSSTAIKRSTSCQSNLYLKKMGTKNGAKSSCLHICSCLMVQASSVLQMYDSLLPTGNLSEMKWAATSQSCCLWEHVGSSPHKVNTHHIRYSLSDWDFIHCHFLSLF